MTPKTEREKVIAHLQKRYKADEDVTVSDNAEVDRLGTWDADRYEVVGYWVDVRVWVNPKDLEAENVED